MKDVVDDCDETWRRRNFQSSSKWGFVGWQLNYILYQFSLRFHAPDVIEFQRYRQDTTTPEGRKVDGIDENLWRPADPGEMEFYSDHYAWVNRLDIPDKHPDFFTEPPEEQFRILKDFFIRSMEYADKTWGKGR